MWWGLRGGGWGTSKAFVKELMDRLTYDVI